MNRVHEANRRHWNRSAGTWDSLREADGLWRRCCQEPHLAFEGRALEVIREVAGDPAGKDVCIIGSGDNYAAFALAGLGARVVSTDLSEAQLGVASRRARQLGLPIAFVQADAAELGSLAGSSFDLVCSTNGFFVWIANLEGVFRQVHRILRPGGFYVFYDVHPFQRPWKDAGGPIQMEKPYWETGPFQESEEGPFEFHWTTGDLLNALARAGLVLHRVEESPAGASRFWQGCSYLPGTDPGLTNWKRNPRAGLPAWLTVAAGKLSNT